MKQKQALLGIDQETKQIIDEQHKLKGFKTRSKYIKSLVLKDKTN